MRLPAFLFLLVFSKPLAAQFLDSLPEVIRGKSNVDLRLESRWSLVDNGAIRINGIRAGAAYEKKLRIGGGVNWLKTDVSGTITEIDETGQSTSKLHYLKLAYAVGYVDAVFYKTKRWQLSVPIQIGLGATWYQEEKKYSFQNVESPKFLFIYEPGITVQFKISRWLGLGLDWAYRFALKNNDKISEQLNSPTLSPKLMIWLDQLYFLALPESEWSKRSGPASW